MWVWPGGAFDVAVALGVVCIMGMDLLVGGV